jgi:hypothetical protein
MNPWLKKVLIIIKHFIWTKHKKESRIDRERKNIPEAQRASSVESNMKLLANWRRPETLESLL